MDPTLIALGINVLIQGIDHLIAASDAAGNVPEEYIRARTEFRERLVEAMKPKDASQPAS